MGCGSSGQGEIEGVKRQPWLSSIDWQKLEAKDIAPPLVPDANKPNFDLTHELEELLLEEHPLKVRKRKANRDMSKLTPELKQLEEQFTSYDFRKTRRRTYYPHNQQLISSVTSATSDLEPESRPSTPAVFDADLVASESKPNGDEVQVTIEPPERTAVPSA